MAIGKINGDKRVFNFLQFSSNIFFILFMISCTLEKKVNASNGRFGLDSYHYNILPLNSMLPPFACNPNTPQGPSRKASSKVVHRYGPCSSSARTSPTMSELLVHDESRVTSIHNRIKSREPTESESGTLPAKSSTSMGVGNYVVTVGLGTPSRTLELVFDTGSQFTWTQCEPCALNCYKQRDRIFDPSASTTYSNITCGSMQCSALVSATSYRPRCTPSNTCVYEAHYGDGTFSVGELAEDTLTLTSSDSITRFLFGCGQNNDLYFGDNDGLMGLGSDELSIVSQTSQKFGKYFSYCLPTKTGSNGHLTFGKIETNSNNVKFTPFSSSPRKIAFYFIEITAITVNQNVLPIDPTVFKSSGTIIDSGTVITRLPPAAYTSLSDAFRKLMTIYPTAEGTSLLDTCYDFTKHPKPKIPEISFTFGGGLDIDLDPQGVMVPLEENASRVCLAFAGNQDASDVGILGNIQQQTFEVVYDVAGGKLGFAPGGCS